MAISYDAISQRNLMTEKMNEVSNQIQETESNLSYNIQQSATKTKNILSSVASKLSCGMVVLIVFLTFGIFMMSMTMMQLQSSVNSLNDQITAMNLTLDTSVTELEAKVDSLNAELESYQVRVEKLSEEIATKPSAVETPEVQTPKENNNAAVAPSATQDPEAPVTYNYTSITSKTGFTAEQLDNIISTTMSNLNKGQTKLQGLGTALYTAEQDHNVNALFLLGVAGLESGWGTNKLATNSNNLYGLIGMKFNSTSECTLYMGKLIRNNYIDSGLTTISAINNKYCPGYTKWTSDVTWIMNQFVKTAQTLYGTASK